MLDDRRVAIRFFSGALASFSRLNRSRPASGRFSVSQLPCRRPRIGPYPFRNSFFRLTIWSVSSIVLEEEIPWDIQSRSKANLIAHR